MLKVQTLIVDIQVTAYVIDGATIVYALIRYVMKFNCILNLP